MNYERACCGPSTCSLVSTKIYDNTLFLPLYDNIIYDNKIDDNKLFLPLYNNNRYENGMIGFIIYQVLTNPYVERIEPKSKLHL